MILVFVFEYLYHQFLHPHFDTSIEYTFRDEPLEFLTPKASEFYKTLADRLLLMMERQPNWEFITFEGP